MVSKRHLRKTWENHPKHCKTRVFFGKTYGKNLDKSWKHMDKSWTQMPKNGQIRHFRTILGAPVHPWPWLDPRWGPRRPRPNPSWKRPPQNHPFSNDFWPIWLKTVPSFSTSFHSLHRFPKKWGFQKSRVWTLFVIQSGVCFIVLLTPRSCDQGEGHQDFLAPGVHTADLMQNETKERRGQGVQWQFRDGLMKFTALEGQKNCFVWVDVGFIFRNEDFQLRYCKSATPMLEMFLTKSHWQVIG